jgi:hypothetical protein
MHQDNTTDLRWWLISNWSAYVLRVIMTGVAAGLVTMSWVALAAIFIGIKAVGGLALGVIAGIVGAFFFGRNTEDNQEFGVGSPPGILPFSN